MVNLIFTLFAALVSTAPLTLALTIHKDAVALAYDNETNWMIAYDRDLVELERYHNVPNFFAAGNHAVPTPGIAPKCTSLGPQEIKSLPAWPKIEAYARSRWGGGSYNLYTNNGGPPATSCVPETIIQVYTTGSPVCNTATGTSNGTFVGRGGTITLAFTSGYSSTEDFSVTKTATLSVGYTASMSVGIPGVGEAGVSLTVAAEFSNSLTRGFSTTTNSEASHTLTTNAEAGDTCFLQYTAQTCHQPSRGSVPFTAKGWAVFGFNDRTQGHYYWYVNMEAVSTEAERSSYVDFTGSIHGRTSGSFTSVCRH
ncbi:hypothetical protein DFH09DRAFT_1161565 [Mycena vulgaris]|nr:hypothetical protein DFH09DRAFT_1161565 [Mycena vulgaris]